MSPRPIAPATPIMPMTPNTAFRDYRGGGRSSARETASRVAAGAVARLVIPEVSILAYVSAIGGDAIDMDHFDADEIGNNPFFCPMLGSRTLGKIRRCRAQGWLLARRGGRMRRHRRSRGLGRAALRQARQRTCQCHDEHQRGEGRRDRRRLRRGELAGEQNADPMRPGENGSPSFSPTMRAASRAASRPASRSVVRVAFKPTSSILTPVDTITREGETSEIVTKGRHDPCVGIRGVPVVEAMMALVLADHASCCTARNFCGILSVAR
jgi:chorismate synthase